MPELPEVETVVRGLCSLLDFPAQIVAIGGSSHRLRRDGSSPQKALGGLRGQYVLAIERRAKFIVWHTHDYVVINHLGMTGAWLGPSAQARAHDHRWLTFVGPSGQRRELVYNDPRRFGAFEVVPRAGYLEHPSLVSLGPEPLDRKWKAEHLYLSLQRRRAPIKAVLMDQKVVVGVGNIYASEVCFQVGVNPESSASSLSFDVVAQMHSAIRTVLRAAIRAGGSTIRDYRQAGGGSGLFQTRFAVYDRVGETCHRCGGTIVAGRHAGRSTFWCSQCQPFTEY